MITYRVPIQEVDAYGKPRPGGLRKLVIVNAGSRAEAAGVAKLRARVLSKQYGVTFAINEHGIST